MLHNEQADLVAAAIDAAQSEGAGGDASGLNKNTNANALAFICQQFINRRSEDHPG